VVGWGGGVKMIQIKQEGSVAVASENSCRCCCWPTLMKLHDGDVSRMPQFPSSDAALIALVYAHSRAIVHEIIAIRRRLFVVLS
jgi:hypothetical protein